MSWRVGGSGREGIELNVEGLGLGVIWYFRFNFSGVFAIF